MDDKSTVLHDATPRAARTFRTLGDRSMQPAPVIHNRPRTPPRAAVRRLALGRFISFTGTVAAGTALSYSLYAETGSAAWVAAAMVLTWGVIGLLGPISGAIGDRYDRRRVMIVGETAAAACWFAMATLVDAPVVLLGLAFLASAFEAPFPAASGAAIPNVAGIENLSWANSLISMGRYAGLTLGPLAGGLLVASIGARWMFVANAVSYLISVALVWSVRAEFADPERDAQEVEDHKGLAAGFRFIRRDRVLTWLLASWVVFILGMASTIVADPVLADAFGWGSFGYGLITTCWGAGTIVGAWLGRNVRQDQEAVWLIGFSGLVALTGFGVFFSPWFWLVLVWVLLFGLADGPTQVAEQNLLQRRTPDVVRSRVMGAWEAANHLSLVIAFVIGGLVVPEIGPKPAYLLGGVTGLLGTALLLPLLRLLPRRGTSVDAPVHVEQEPVV
jgi:MFS family permease